MHSSPIIPLRHPSGQAEVDQVALNQAPCGPDAMPTAACLGSTTDAPGGKDNKGTLKKKFARGRWTQAEHNQFLAGYQVHGKLWRKIVPFVKTRTAVQIRTHAQKYFLALRQMAEKEAFDVDTDNECLSSSSDHSAEGAGAEPDSKKPRLDSEDDWALAVLLDDEATCASVSLDDACGDHAAALVCSLPPELGGAARPAGHMDLLDDPFPSDAEYCLFSAAVLRDADFCFLGNDDGDS